MKETQQIIRTANCRARNHLFGCWPQVAKRIKYTSHLELFLDFDGTLTRIRPRPEQVPPLDPSIRKVLRDLAGCRRLDVHVISGRRLSDLRSLIRVPGIHLSGLHGWEGRGAPPLGEEREHIRRAKQLLAQRLAKMTGVRLEDKNLGLAVHYRGALPSQVRAARLIVQGVLEQFKPQLRLFKGKKVWEVFPAALGGKGLAVRWLLRKRRRPTLAIFVGDDATDELAFAALPRGITVRVGNTRWTRAHFYLRNPREVLTFLQRLEAEIA